METTLGPPSLAVASFIELYNSLLSDEDKFYIHDLVGTNTFHDEYEKLYHLHHSIDIPLNEWLKIGSAEWNIESNRKFIRRWKQIKPLIKSIVYRSSIYCLCLTREYQSGETPISLEDINDTDGTWMIEYKNEIYDIQAFFHGPHSGTLQAYWKFEDWYTYSGDEGEDSDDSDDSDEEGKESWSEKFDREDEEAWAPFIDGMSK